MPCPPPPPSHRRNRSRHSSPALALSWHLARAGGRRGVHANLLAAGAGAIAALVLLLLLAFWAGAATRAQRTAWRTPLEDPNGSAVQVLSTTSVRGRLITVVDLAQLLGRPAAPAPPGLAAFPKPGQVYLSPALADLVRRLPASQLADRFPHPSGTGGYRRIGAAGLTGPGELVAVIGRAAGNSAVASSAGTSGTPTGVEGRARVSTFASDGSGALTADDRDSTVLAAGLLLGPVLVLASAAGRLGAARREQRLAGLRLAGATPVQILAITGWEAAAVGAGGAAVGAAGYAGLLPALSHVPFGIGAWHVGDLWIGLPRVLAVVTVMALLCAGSAITALRRVAVSPLGVAHQSDPRRTRAIRLVLFAVLIAYLSPDPPNGIGLGPWHDRAGAVRPGMMDLAEGVHRPDRGAPARCSHCMTRRWLTSRSTIRIWSVMPGWSR